MIIALLLTATAGMPVMAQEYTSPLVDVPFQVHEVPQIEIQDNARIHYDIYDRATRIEEIFPLGYTATTEYTWWPNTYLREDGAYEPRMQREIGKLFNKGNKQVAFYEIIYDEKEQEIKKTTEGNQLVKRLLSLFAKILGIEINKEKDLFS